MLAAEVGAHTALAVEQQVQAVQAAAAQGQI
jgi:hypothetical protein